MSRWDGIHRPPQPELPPRPVIRNKIIGDYKHEAFEESLDKFLDQLDSYSLQYKPVMDLDGELYYTVLVTYHTEEEGE